MRPALLLGAAFVLTGAPTQACSCIGNQSFCETLSPDFFGGFFSDPGASLAVVVPLETYYYGVKMEVAHVIAGAALPDTIMVWGDNGALCRIYVGFEPGDTVVLALNVTDLLGNTIQNPEYPPDLEHPGDYMVSVCGVHAADFANGRVVGSLNGPQTQSMTLAEFTALVTTCSGTQGITDPDDEGLLCVAGSGGHLPVLSLGTARKARIEVLDATGRRVLDRAWDGSALPLQGLAPATYVVRLQVDDRLIARKVSVGGSL